MIRSRLPRHLGLLFIFFLLFSCKDAQVPASPSRAKSRFSALTDSAKMHHNAGHTDLALSYHKRALNHAQHRGLRQQQAEALLHIARLLPDQQVDTSLRYLDNALVIARSLNHYQLQSDIYRSIAQIHKQQENYTAALFALEAHHQLADSLLNERRIKDIRQAEIQSKNSQDRLVSTAVTIVLLTISFILAMFFRRTRKLNRKLAQSLSVRDKLFNIIGHDLRGPAGSIKQALQLINSGTIDQQELPGFLTMVENQSYMLNDTLDTLLAWSRSQFNEISQNPVFFSAMESVDNTMALLEGQYKAKDVRINLDVPDELKVYADRDQFDFVIRNLLSNAIKFSHTGGVIGLVIRRNKSWTEISITDYGIGISLERQHLFRAENLETTFGTSGEKGTGLGLRMIKDFVSAAGGKISLKSKTGETNFCVSLPYPRN